MAPGFEGVPDGLVVGGGGVLGCGGRDVGVEKVKIVVVVSGGGGKVGRFTNGGVAWSCRCCRTFSSPLSVASLEISVFPSLRNQSIGAIICQLIFGGENNNNVMMIERKKVVVGHSHRDPNT